MEPRFPLRGGYSRTPTPNSFVFVVALSSSSLILEWVNRASSSIVKLRTASTFSGEAGMMKEVLVRELREGLYHSFHEGALLK